MKTIDKIRERRAVSPVIATVILVAIAITVAVAVSYWMSGIAGQYTAFEKIEIQSGYAEIKTSSSTVPGGWTITLEMKNSGSATANLMSVFINDKPVNVYDVDDTTDGGFALGDVTTDKLVGPTETGVNFLEAGLAIESGKTAEVGAAGSGIPVKVYIGSGLFSSGTTINVKIHSAGGMDYIKLIKLV